MWGHRHLDGRAVTVELVGRSPWIDIAVAEICVCRGLCPGCMLSAGDCLACKMIPSWCGVEGSSVGTGLGSVCSVALACGGWGEVAPCRHSAVHGRGGIHQEVLEVGTVCLVHAVWMCLHRHFGGGAVLGVCTSVGRGFMAFVFDMCVLFGGGPL
ncbi:hypothetical protein AMECASPLE_035551 [Ameca splendens]|uniref:Uncharacterized protein n=1 Tax=Ameca splendens TaxID=208324 RepID=A0ABV0ZHH3_9TELE